MAILRLDFEKKSILEMNMQELDEYFSYCDRIAQRERKIEIKRERKIYKNIKKWKQY